MKNMQDHDIYLNNNIRVWLTLFFIIFLINSCSFIRIEKHNILLIENRADYRCNGLSIQTQYRKFDVCGVPNLSTRLPLKVFYDKNVPKYIKDIDNRMYKIIE